MDYDSSVNYQHPDNFNKRIFVQNFGKNTIGIFHSPYYSFEDLRTVLDEVKENGEIFARNISDLNQSTSDGLTLDYHNIRVFTATSGLPLMQLIDTFYPDKQFIPETGFNYEASIYGLTASNLYDVIIWLKEWRDMNET
jgi:hypothetical protein